MKELSKDRLEEEKKMYENLLNEFSEEINQIEKVTDKLIERKSVFVDFAVIKDRSSLAAEETIKSFLKFYIPDNTIRKTDFVKNKANMDRLVLEKIFYQSESAEFAYTKLLEKIDEGNAGPRDYEVLATLQSSILNVLKFIVQIQNVMELTYKNIVMTYYKNQNNILNDNPHDSENSEKNENDITAILKEMQESEGKNESHLKLLNDVMKARDL